VKSREQDDAEPKNPPDFEPDCEPGNAGKAQAEREGSHAATGRKVGNKAPDGCRLSPERRWTDPDRARSREFGKSPEALNNNPNRRSLVKSLKLRSALVRCILILIITASAIAVLSDLQMVRFLTSIQAGAKADEALGAAIDQRQLVIGLSQSFLTLICAITFLMWFYRAHKNLAAGGLVGLKYSPGWAVGGFFVPFLNLVRPLQVMKEVASGSAYLADHAEGESWQADSASPLVGWWWGGLLLQGGISRVSARMMLKANEVDELVRAGWATLAADAFTIPAAILAILLVYHVSRLQDQAIRAAHDERPFGVDSANDAYLAHFE
jgi:hypothetical protein